MSVAKAVREYLARTNIDYDNIEHRKTACSSETALASFVPADELAKAVVIKAKDRYLLSIVPCSEKVDLEEVGELIGEPVTLATEKEIEALFPDCERGAIPPIAAAYGMEALVDESLDEKDDIYFEAGDHKTLVHVSGATFARLMRHAPHSRLCMEDNKPVLFVSPYRS